MNVSRVLTKEYEKCQIGQFMKTNPIQTQPIVSLSALPALSAAEGSVVEGVEAISKQKQSGWPKKPSRREDSPLPTDKAIGQVSYDQFKKK